jgi:hypothetical protein
MAIYMGILRRLLQSARRKLACIGLKAGMGFLPEVFFYRTHTSIKCV